MSLATPDSILEQSADGASGDVRICEICDVAFSGKWSRKYCSQECRSEKNRKRVMEWRKKNPKKRMVAKSKHACVRRKRAANGDAKPIRVCEHCGATSADMYGNKYCSPECVLEKNRERARLWWKNNTGRAKENAARYSKNNREARRKSVKGWLKNNQESVKENHKTWLKKNPEKVIEYRRRSNEKRRKEAGKNPE